MDPLQLYKVLIIKDSVVGVVCDGFSVSQCIRRLYSSSVGECSNTVEQANQPPLPPPPSPLLRGTIGVATPSFHTIKSNQPQALDVQLREPDMEVSAKQEGSKRFDDPGIAAALAGDFDADSPTGLLSSATSSAKSGKMEPKVQQCIGSSPRLSFCLVSSCLALYVV